MYAKAITLMAVVVLLFSSVPFVKGEEIVVESVDTTVSCVNQLPQAEYLGEGPGEYTLPPGYSKFVVKEFSGGHYQEQPGPTITLEKSNPNKDNRVWACEGECGQFKKLKSSNLQLGRLNEGDQINLLALDDDNDDRYHWWSVKNPMDPYEMIVDNRMVEYLSLTIPASGDGEKWWFHTEDSLGVAMTCLTSQATFTPVATNTSLPTATNTSQPTATNTPLPTMTSTAEPTATEESTVEPTATSTNTPLPTATITNTPLPTPTPTTVIDPVSFTFYYLPIIHCEGNHNPINFCTQIIYPLSAEDMQIIAANKAN